MKPWQTAFIEQYRLSTDYIKDAAPIIAWLEQQINHSVRPYCLGINGAQGSGKSTLAAYLVAHLNESGYRAATVSIDDFYLSSNERKKRARQLHPLFATRGVPGTHDVALGQQVLADFKQGSSLQLPRFDKATDEPCATYLWPKHQQPLDILVFEGWCVGIAAQSNEQLIDPINQLEREDDENGHFRTLVNAFLASDYQPLFAHLDNLIYLDVGHFERVFKWRLQQEKQLIARTGKGMSERQIKYFIMFFQRLTEHGFDVLPQLCDLHVKALETHRFML
ncbi:kinase [Pseudoalteromonas sp. JBTF-M23]|uniref:Kinase n=1 Tax=Pseudoalteromonas caenipelagi TaxID=2726988 RepID=A0A849V8R4_9GAMM|nr:kinase [Pseudoalteromonas caenipelagi]NOU49722.1 kinase [Pseudoalteromonas caenipelagi]